MLSYQCCLKSKNSTLFRTFGRPTKPKMASNIHPYISRRLVFSDFKGNKKENNIVDDKFKYSKEKTYTKESHLKSDSDEDNIHRSKKCIEMIMSSGIFKDNNKSKNKFIWINYLFKTYKYINFAKF